MVTALRIGQCSLSVSGYGFDPPAVARETDAMDRVFYSTAPGGALGER